GRSEISARAAKAHTGALVGNDAINDAAFKQLGIVRVESLEDLLITAALLGYRRPLLGRRMGLVTPSGGACDIMADRAHAEGLLLPDFAPETVRGLQQILPEFSTIHNPLDVTGYLVVDRTLQQRALQVVVDDPGLDFIVYLSEPPRVEPPAPQMEGYLEMYRSLGVMMRGSRIPVVVLSNTSVDLTPFGRFISDHAGIHFAGGVEHGTTAAREFGFPVALKIQTDDILHKSDVGGVVLNIAGEDELREGFEMILHTVGRKVNAIDSILVSPMRPAGIELLVGIIQDDSWGQ